MEKLENYFDKFRQNVIGINQEFDSPYGRKKIVYADWTASGRMYLPIERKMIEEVAPFVGNTHTETSVTGSTMTLAYHEALKRIKAHFNADSNDVIISQYSGMTGVINKFQRMLGIRIHEKYSSLIKLPEEERPVVFITHMEHHSNQTSWLECLVDVVIIPADDNGLVCPENLYPLLEKYKHRKHKIAAITSCSNVTGILTPYHEIAEIMHTYGGLCFVDFAASAPYININMHPDNTLQALDAIYFSPHKFLGGPATTGILIFNKELYNNKIPDQPGGGTVKWTNPWGEHQYLDDIESREDGGTPAFLQTIKIALCLKLKEEMNVDKILKREHEIINKLRTAFRTIPNLHMLADNDAERLGIISLYIEGLHYNLGVRLLNDKFGIQVRGGCSCAGTYGHYLLNVDINYSHYITDKINHGDLSDKPGWIRVSIHPVMTDSEVDHIVSGMQELCKNYSEWSKDYIYDNISNEFYYKHEDRQIKDRVIGWFEK